MPHTYIQFKLLIDRTHTRKVNTRQHPPILHPKTARRYRYFDVSEDIPTHEVDELPEQHMRNISAWEDVDPIVLSYNYTP